MTKAQQGARTRATQVRQWQKISAKLAQDAAAARREARELDARYAAGRTALAAGASPDGVIQAFNAPPRLGRP